MDIDSTDMRREMRTGNIIYGKIGETLYFNVKRECHMVFGYFSSDATPFRRGIVSGIIANITSVHLNVINSL